MEGLSLKTTSESASSGGKTTQTGRVTMLARGLDEHARRDGSAHAHVWSAEQKERNGTT